MTPTWEPQVTADGSFTFYSEEFQEAFHSRLGARDEAESKYVRWCRLRERATGTGPLRLLDVCYGLGYNSAAALAAIQAVNPACPVEIVALELDPTVPVAVVESPLLQDWPETVQPLLTALARQQPWREGDSWGELRIGDARDTIRTLAASDWRADAIFLDPFSPKHCPHLWTVEFLAQVARCLAPEGILVTYCRAAAVRAALQQAGLHLGSIPPLEGAPQHQWSMGTVARWQPRDLPPLPLAEQEHLLTRAAVPYRDPTLDTLGVAQLLQGGAHVGCQCSAQSLSSGVGGCADVCNRPPALVPVAAGL